MFSKQNKYQLAFKAQYLPILAVAAVERVWFYCGLGIFFFAGVAPGFAFCSFQDHEKLTPIAFCCINVYLFPSG